MHGLLAVLVAAYVMWLVLRPSDAYSPLVDGWMVDGFELVVALLCLSRATTRAPGRAIALTLGLGLLSWCIGDILLTVESLGGATPPTLSLADAFYLAFYPLAYVAVVLYMRTELRALTAASWLDGAIAGLGAAAVCATFAFRAIERDAGGGAMSVATNLAYPIGDLLLLALVVGGAAVLSGRTRPPLPLVLIAIACIADAAGDVFNLFSSTIGGSQSGRVVNDVAWPIALLLMSAAVWLGPRRANLLAHERPSGFLLPGAATAAGLVILFVGVLHRVGPVPLGLATATLVLAGIRLGLSARSLELLTEKRHQLSVTDELTGLGNRRHLFNVLDAFFADPCLADRSLAFVFVDLNRFKEVNDSFGHHAGDSLLRQLGPRLVGCLWGGDVLVRLGGDEFAVVIVDADAGAATAVAERVSASLAEPFVLDSVLARIDASMGIAVAPRDASDSAGLVRCADAAMYRAKLAGIPCAVYDRERDDDGNQLRLVEELREAVELGRLVVHYQPQLDLRTGEVRSVEALVRWPHPRLGLVQPLEFIPLAEDAGLMPALTALVLDDALAQCAAWRREGRNLAVSVNAEPSNLVDAGFGALIARLLERHHLPAEALVLEITESCIISDYEGSASVIDGLRELGIVVSIDDFGAGVTSLASLGGLAVGELKLDRVFITGLASGKRRRDLELVRSTIGLGHAIGMRVVAEGVEDRATLQLLEELGCDRAQGYFISVPLPAHKIEFAPVIETESETPRPLLGQS